jgi:hypothetical protein
MSSEKIIVKTVGDGLVVVGDTYSYRDTLKTMGGIWNSNLKMGETAVKGWVFPKIKLAEINEFIKKASDGKVKPLEKSTPQSSTISQKDFLSLITRIEKLENEFAQLKFGKEPPKVKLVFQKNNGASHSLGTENEETVDEDDDEQSEIETEKKEQHSVRGLLHRK